MKPVVNATQPTANNRLNATQLRQLSEQLAWLFEQSNQALEAGNIPVAIQALAIARDLTGGLTGRELQPTDTDTLSLFRDLHKMVADCHQLIRKLGQEGAYLIQVLADHCRISLKRAHA